MAQEFTEYTSIGEAVRKQLYWSTGIEPRMADGNFRVVHARPENSDAIVRRITLDLLGCRQLRQTVEETRYPMDWWQAFKARWFPGWLLHRFPVQEKRISMVTEHWHMCPHIAVDNQGPHIAWMRPNGGG